MPELPEVEILSRHLNRQLQGRVLRELLQVHPRFCPTADAAGLGRRLRDCRIQQVKRRAKYILFHLVPETDGTEFPLIAHLGMTGRIFCSDSREALPKHTVLAVRLDEGRLVFEDPRRFGRLTLDATCLDGLGPEPLEESFTSEVLCQALRDCRQPVKVALLDQARVAGIGNIYTSESLYLAGIHPQTPAGELKSQQVSRLRETIRAVLNRAIDFGSGLELRPESAQAGNRVFYFGTGGGVGKAEPDPEERFAVYDREDEDCGRCGGKIVRIELGGRSTYFCGGCQKKPIQRGRKSGFKNVR